MKNKELLTQPSLRWKKRYTIDNRLCKNPFKHKGDYFFDCTDTEAPDNSHTGNEWCYVENPGVGDKDWEFCNPTLDYDKVREFTQIQMKKISIEAKKLNDEVYGIISPTQGALDNLRRINELQSHLSTKFGDITTQINTLTNNILNLNDLKNHWQKLEDKCTTVAEQIEVKVIDKITKETNNFQETLQVTGDVVKREELINKQKINPALQYKLLDNSYDCSGKLLYEDQNDGDGVVAQYFDNSDFLGEFHETREANIDFDWTGDMPAPNISPSVFSARFEAYILPPVTSSYIFSIECDDGCQVAINDDVIIFHKMKMANADSKERVDTWLKREVAAKLSPSGVLYKSKSKGIYLLGATKYKVVVFYSHSVHNDSQDLGRSFLKLYWSSDEFDERIVSKRVLYTQSANPPLKIVGISSETMIVRKLLENDLAFKDSNKYVLQDIPKDYEGLTCLKLDVKYKQPILSFELNIPSYVYIARFIHFPNPLANDFENTGEKLSILEVPTNPNSVGQVRFQSIRSGVMKIYRKKFDAGYISIPLNMQSINVKGIPLIIFFGSDNSLMNPVSCGGNEMWISDPTSKSFRSCSTSSYWEAYWKCENGLNGDYRDSEGSMWASKREGIGAWLEISFQSMYHLTRIEVKNRRNAQERNSILEISFSNGRKQLIRLPNTEDITSIPLDPPQRSNRIRFTIKGTYGTINNGGAFKVFGLECRDIDNDVLTSRNYINTSATALNRAAFREGGINPNLLPPLFKAQERPPILLLCKDSLSNTKKLDHATLKPGAQVRVRCLETCFRTNFPIYGDMKYSKDSAICKAAYHSGVLTQRNQIFWLKFENGASDYSSTIRSGIKSKNKSFSELSISFENALDVDSKVIINLGGKFDLLDPNGSGLWLPAVIMKVEESGIYKKLTVNIENTEGNSNQYIVNYPDTHIAPCGTKIPKRFCNGSLIEIDNDVPITIKFEPLEYPRKTQYLIDSGLTFGKSGKSYGWDRDMTNRVKSRGRPTSDPVLETFVEFPPDPKSKFCNTDRPEVVCDKASWSAKVGFGKFNIKLYIGDILANTRVDLSVNGIPLVKQSTIEKGKLEVFEGIFDSVNEYITISPKCSFDCEYSMAKLNMITIIPFKDKKELSREHVKPIVKDPCGNAFTGGKCETGPDVVHCLYEDISVDSAKYCSGNAILVQVPSDYQCVSQRNKYKCVLRVYDKQNVCMNFCPYKCKNSNCSE